MSSSEANLPPLSEQQARDWVFRRLAMREHSRMELRKGLIGRGFSRAQADALLDAFAASGYQSDERYQEAYARHQAKQGKGTRWIQMKLKEKGVQATGEKLAEIAQEATGSTELDRAVDFLRRRYQTQVASEEQNRLEAQKERMRFRNRLLSALVRRGFSFETAQKAFQLFETESELKKD